MHKHNADVIRNLLAKGNLRTDGATRIPHSCYVTRSPSGRGTTAYVMRERERESLQDLANRQGCCVSVTGERERERPLYGRSRVKLEPILHPRRPSYECDVL